MNCHKIKTLLVPFLEGDLSRKVREDIAVHLKTCASCQREKDLLSKTWQMLDDYTVPKLKDDFTTSLMRKIHSEQAEIINVRYRFPRFSFQRLVPVLATALIVILTVSLFLNRTINKDRLVKAVPQITKGAEIAMVDEKDIIEEEIINNLEILQNYDLLENFDLVSDLEVVENLEESLS